MTPEMRAVGVAIIDELSGVVDSTYVAEQVYRAMAQLTPPNDCLKSDRGNADH